MGEKGVRMRFEESPEVAEAVEAVYALTANLKRGDILIHERITAVLGLQPHEGFWDHVVHKAMRRLERERGIAYWDANSLGYGPVGYKLLTTAEQIEVGGRRMAKACRQMRKGRKSVEALPDAGLSLHQRRAKMFNLDRLKSGERAIKSESRRMKQQVRPTGSVPRRPVMAEA